MNNLQRFRQGKYNQAQQKWLPDGSVIITLIDDKAGKVYKFRVKDIKTPNEQEVDIDTGEPIAE